MVGKRPAYPPAEGGEQAYQKRQKIAHVTTSAEDIQSSRQLQQLLAFDQDAGRAKHGIQSFKALLEGLSDPEYPNRITILREYFLSQKPQDEEDKTAVFLSDIMQTWSFASQSNNESLLSAVPAVLALLLKSISNILEFSEPGLRLCRTLLQKRQLELIARGITANKTKDFVISPALRLLKEVASFDGGAVAKQVFRARDSTFKALARNLGLRSTGDTVEDRRKPSVRTNALRYLLAVIKFIPSESKKELLSQRDVVSALVREIRDDPPYMVVEILDTLKASILQDDALPREFKTKLLNANNLGRIVTLYGYDHSEEEFEGKRSVDGVVHDFLMLACTSPDLGILHRQNGFYPRGVDPNDSAVDVEADTQLIDLGLDSIEWANKFTEKVPVRNTTLSEFLQTLRPWSSIKQSELLLAVLKAAPELVADYFFGKKSFSFDPKLTATWIGYSAFLFSTVQMPVPEYFGMKDGYAKLPPPTSLVIENILPQPLNQKALTRCLNQKSNLITFFAVRLLAVAFDKLRVILSLYRQAAIDHSNLWTQASEKLVQEFCRRCPSMKDAVNTLKALPEVDIMQREAVSRLLVAYYEAVPQLALDAKFDVSSSLTQTLQLLETSNASPEDKAMRSLELEHLFHIAKCSPGMRWFNKVESINISPFTAMLKLAAEASSNAPPSRLRTVLRAVTDESQLLQHQTELPALDALISSLKLSSDDQSVGAVYEFIDNCILRCTTTPIKYLDRVEELYTESYGSKASDDGVKKISVSLLILTIAEQWPFKAKSGSEEEVKAIATFVANYFAASLKIEEDKKILKLLIKTTAAETPEEASSYRKTIEKSKKLVDDLEITASVDVIEQVPVKAHTQNKEAIDKQEVLENMLEQAEPSFSDNGAVLRWTTKEIEEVIEDGHVAALIRLLSSDALGIRKEATTNLAKMAIKVKESSYEEKDQIWLLLLEVVETSKLNEDPLPSVITSFAANAVAVLCNPLHPLYPKINKFLSQGPTWDADKVPLMHTVLHEAPTRDDAHYEEIAWLLTYMTSGLRSPVDMAIYHKRRVFEKLLSLYNNAYINNTVREQILRLLFRATKIEGGSTTLITRFSSMSWLEAQAALEKGVALKVLVEKLLETCDEERVKKWSKTDMKKRRIA